MSGEPFIGSEALADGSVRKHQLRAQFRAVFPGVYVGRHAQLTLRQRVTAAWLWSGRRGVVAGLTAAAWHGSRWVDDDLPVELVWSNARPPPGIRTYDMRLRPSEFASAGLPVTTPQRTAFDLGRRKPLGVAIARLDALMRVTDVEPREVFAVADQHPGARGRAQLRTALDAVDTGSQSPKETWLRLLLIRAGLPRPATQIPVVAGGQMYFLDMGWPSVMVAVEYDGEQHRVDRRQYTSDLRRSEALARLGWIVIRVVADDGAADIVRRVQDARAFRASSMR